MRIENNEPFAYKNEIQTAASHGAGLQAASERMPVQASNAVNGQTDKAKNSAEVSVEISEKAREAYLRSLDEKNAECETCKSRKYQDGSDDSSVSFQAPTHLSPEQAASAVVSHENEHVSHEQAKAAEEGRRIVSQTVTIQTSSCPECGRVYVSGGVTRTITARDNRGEQNNIIDLYA